MALIDGQKSLEHFKEKSWFGITKAEMYGTHSPQLCLTSAKDRLQIRALMS